MPSPLAEMLKTQASKAIQRAFAEDGSGTKLMQEVLSGLSVEQLRKLKLETDRELAKREGTITVEVK